jgi:ketosteroid isomerase-like protein
MPSRPEGSAVVSIRDDYERGIRLYNAGDLERYANEYADDAVLVTPSVTAHGRAAIGKSWSRQKTAFPDCTLTVNALLEQGDTIMTEWTWAGTHMGPLARRDGTEVQPTGRRIEHKGMELAKIRNGRIHVYHIYWDGLAIYRQLGLLQP